MTRFRTIFSIGLCLIFSLSVSAQTTKVVNVPGTVTDTITGAPIEGAQVVVVIPDTALDIAALLSGGADALKDIKINKFVSDTCVTNSQGKFSSKLTVDASANVVIVAGNKVGYSSGIAYGGIISLGTMVTIYPALNIKLTKTLDLPKDTVIVSGRILDFTTQTPILGAKAVISEGLTIDPSTNAVTTDGLGKFSKQVVVSRKADGTATLFIIANADGYKGHASQKVIKEKGSFDLGDIVLTKSDVGISTHALNMSTTIEPDLFEIYAINGKLLSKGEISALSQAIKAISQPAIINYLKGTLVISSERILPVK